MTGSLQSPRLDVERPFVLHISADFPDPLVPDKTPVIRSLVDLTAAQFEHQVVSLNRNSPGLADLARPWKWGQLAGSGQSFSYGKAYVYNALPYGIGHLAALRRLGDELAARFEERKPALIIGHKLTIEGLIAAHVAQALAVPYAVTIQGNTDCKILAARPDLRGAIGRAFHQASHCFALAPWALESVERHLGKRSGPTGLLAAPTDLDRPIAPLAKGDGLVSVFNLKHFANKNLAGMANAVTRLRAEGADYSLKIIGGGEAEDLLACDEIVRQHTGVRLTGAAERVDLADQLNRATGFVLPSHRESFGLVFIEALFAGLPIIYPKGAAIDGYFDGLPFAIPVPSRDTDALLAAMRRLTGEEQTLKEKVRQWQLSDHAKQFTRPAIAANFSQGLERSLSQGALAE